MRFCLKALAFPIFLACSSPVFAGQDCPAGADPTYCNLANATGGKVVVCPKGPPDVLAKCMAQLNSGLSSPKSEGVLARDAGGNVVASPEVLACQKLLTAAPTAATREMSRRLQKTLRNHVHLRGTAHIPIPHMSSTWDDVLAARAEVSEADLPGLVKLVVDETISESHRRLARDVVAQFGPKALPCIDAGLLLRSSTGRDFLNDARLSIKIAQGPMAQ